MKVLGRFRASYAQERMWFLNDLLTDCPVYSVPDSWDVAGPLDRAAFDRAVGALVARHEPLRTTFELDGACLMQVVWDEAGQVTHWPETAPGTGEEELDRLVRAEVERPFDLGTGPLVRFVLFRRSEEDHIILMNFHHIIVDMRSIEILQRDLSELYAAQVENRAAVLPDLPVQYADFSVWQRSRLEGLESQRQVESWRRVLAGHKIAELPLVRPRPVSQSYRGRELRFVVDSETFADLRTLSKASGATLYMILMAAFKLVLRVYTGSDDQTVGGLMAGRTVPEVADAIGFFVNTIALRTDLGGDPTFGELVRRVRDTAIEAYDCQDLPFEEVVKLLAPERRGTRNPFFDVLFHMYQTMEAAGAQEPVGDLELAGLAIGTRERPIRLSFFDLELHLEELTERVDVMLVYPEELFDLPFVEQLVSFYLSVLAAAGRDPEARLSQLSEFTEAPDDTRAEWSKGARESWPGTTVVDLIDEVILAHSADTAVVFAGESLTYGELDARSCAIVEHLHSLGIGRGAIVALCCDRGVDLVVGMWAVLKSGAGLLPLDPAYPVDRLAVSLRSAGAALILGTGPADWAAALDGAGWIDLDSLPRRAPARPDRPRVRTDPADTAYVIFTSGSTAVPKGVVMSHGAFHNLVSWEKTEIPAAGGVFGTFASAAFDVSIQEIFGALAQGGRIVMSSEEQRHEPGALLDLFRHEGVQWAHLPPKVLTALCDMAMGRGECLPALRGIISAGERLIAAPGITAFFDAHPLARLYNQYGPTETHAATAYRLPDHTAAWTDTGTIGRPIENADVHVLSGDLGALPAGVPGEICVGGAGVAHGYLGGARATAEKFVPDPFGRPGARLYRTGDRGRWLPDGELAFLGRIDEQVKIRGFRVEPAEVSRELLASGLVSDGIVRAVDSQGGARLVAFAVPLRSSPGGRIDVEALRRHFETKLPAYMVPASFVEIDELPRTANGKIDVARLQPEAAPEHKASHLPPASPLEEDIARVWAELLGIAQIGRHDNFFELGGHSLLAMMVVSRLSALLTVAVSVRDLFIAPTLADLAGRLESRTATTPGE